MRTALTFSLLLCGLFFFFTAPIHAQDTAAESGLEPTMLMFVGENLEVLSIASRREESARQAPAVADVITHREMTAWGVVTLEEALSRIPGFYMAQREWGTQPYLRGIPDSVLFLYDTVPLTLDTNKSLHQLDYGLSLAPIKRIEIIRGPGSVLWGPDAFAGIVNVVPMTGRDLNGIESGVSYRFPEDQKSFYFNAGHDAGRWDALLSLSGRTGTEDDRAGNLVDFWNEEETSALPFEERIGHETPDEARYFEVFGRFAIQDWITITGRLSQNEKPYAITRSEGDLTWLESRQSPFNFIKLEGKKSLGPFSILRFTGSYSWLTPEFEVIDLVLEQKERATYGELIYEHSFLTGQGLLTAGLSYREKQISDAPFWSGALPPFLGPENEFNLAPQIARIDYDTRLWSLFSQYTHKIGDVDVWLGLRYDAHDPYEDRLSYNIGAKWSPTSRWMFKLLYGTAYRTPYARQLLEDEEPKLENIESLSAQIAWQPVHWAGAGIVGFLNRTEDHRVEDPYAGTELSLPNHQNIYGIELEGHVIPVDDLEISANLTLLDNSGPDETYRRLKFVRPLPDGSLERVFEEIEYPYDTGATSMFNLMATWRPVEDLTAFLNLGYFSSRLLVDPRQEEFISVPGAWLLDASVTIEDLFLPGLDLQISGWNLTDRDYETPGTYTVNDGEPVSVEVILKKKW